MIPADDIFILITLHQFSWTILRLTLWAAKICPKVYCNGKKIPLVPMVSGEVLPRTPVKFCECSFPKHVALFLKSERRNKCKQLLLLLSNGKLSFHDVPFSGKYFKIGLAKAFAMFLLNNQGTVVIILPWKHPHTDRAYLFCGCVSIYLPGDSDALGRYRLKLHILRWTIRGW